MKIRQLVTKMLNLNNKNFINNGIYASIKGKNYVDKSKIKDKSCYEKNKHICFSSRNALIRERIPAILNIFNTENKNLSK